MENGFEGKKNDDSEYRSSLSRDDLNKAENSSLDTINSDEQDNESSRSLYREDNDTKKTPIKSKGIFSRRNKIIGGIGLGGGFIGLLIFGFLALIPLKIESIVNNLENRFFSTSENAVSKETDNLFSDYTKKYVLRGYSKCGNTISKECSALSISGNDPVTNLYKSWRNNRLENKLANDYGIEFKKTTSKIGNNSTWKLIDKNSGNEINIGEDGSGLSQVFESSSSSDIRSAIKSSLDNALEGESKWKSVFFRYKVGRLLEEKYGIRRCLFFCGITDPIHDAIATQKKAFQEMLLKKVIEPRSKIIADAISCLIGPSGCNIEDKGNGDSNSPEENGAPSSEFESNLSSDLNSEADALASTTADTLLTDVGSEESTGFTKWIENLVTEKLTAFTATETADNSIDAIPFVGWLNLANTIAQVGNTVNSASHGIAKIKYIAMASSAVALYMMYRTYADEIHTGHVTPTDVGSMTNSLSPGNNDPGSKDAELGGTAGAEQTPLYQYYINGVSPSQASAMASSNSNIASLLLPSTYALTNSSSNSSNPYSTYKCNDGSITTGELTCPEENLKNSAGWVNDIANFFTDSGLGSALSIWNHSFGYIFNGVGWAIGGFLSLIHFSSIINGICSPLSDLGPIAQAVAYAVPGTQGCAIYNESKTYFPKILDAMVNYLLPSPISSNMSGGRTFDMMALGADVSGNDSAHTILGGEKLTPKQVADIYNENQNESLKQESQQPLFARLFDTNSQYSLISKIAMDIPLGNNGSILDSIFSSVISVPLRIFSNIGSVISTKSLAASSPIDDPFGVDQYGYPDGSISSDPETYWQQNCNNNASDGYQNGNTYNEEGVSTANDFNNNPSGMPINNTTNQCLLIKATLGAAGGVFDTSNLTPNDLNDAQN